MLKKYGIYCENCNTLLNNEDDNIFGSNFGHLYHSTCIVGGINNGKSTDCQPLMLFKMNLKFANTPTLSTEAEGEIMELKKFNNAARQHVQQLEAKIKTLEDALLVKDRLKDNVNKLMDHVGDLANTLSINVIDKASDIVKNTYQDGHNLNSDDSSLTGKAETQNIKHRIKTLEDALLQTKTNGNKLTGCVETVEKNKAVDKSPDAGSNITQDPKASKETNSESNLSGEQHNDIENVASASASTSEEHHTYTILEQNQKVLDLRQNCVLILHPLRESFCVVRELANQMNAQIADNSVIHIDDSDYPGLYVYFRDADSKTEFLKNRFIFKYNPNTYDYLPILDYSDCGIVEICNFQSSDLSLETAYVKVDELAKKMRITNIRNFIDHIDVYSLTPNQITYSVRFNCQFMKNEFLKNIDILKKFRETKSLGFSDIGGHTSRQFTLNSNYSMDIASANIIGIAELMGLSLSIDNVKRIYVLNAKQFFTDVSDVLFSLVVEFSSNDIKTKFLKKKSPYYRISDIKTELNSVSIKYKPWAYMFTAISFIGLAKQLGISFNDRNQIRRFITMSKFILEVTS